MPVSHMFMITYVIGKLERTVIAQANNRGQAQSRVAASEPEDCIIHIIKTELLHPDVVVQINERPAGKNAV